MTAAPLRHPLTATASIVPVQKRLPEHDFDAQVVINGYLTDVAVFYDCDTLEVRVFTMDADYAPNAEITVWVSRGDRERLCEEGERLFEEREFERDEAVRKIRLDRLCHEARGR